MLTVKNLEKSYGNKRALCNFSMQFSYGIYAILGVNGCGKTTLLNLLTDNLKRDGGEIFFDGKEILQLKGKYREIIGYMPQQNGYYEDFSVFGFLNYLGKIKGLSRSQRKTQITELLRVMNLENAAGEKMSALSGGMRQRVLFIQALLGNPEILILDEPTAGLDPKERVNMKNYIKSLAADKIIIITTHIVSDIENMADYVLIMEDGTLLAQGTVEELLADSKADNLEDLITRPL